MPREYRKIKGYEKEIIKLREEGKMDYSWIIVNKKDTKERKLIAGIKLKFFFVGS